MENLSFVLWMLGYPLVIVTADVIRGKSGLYDAPLENVRGISALVQMAIWIFVGVALFK